MPAFDCWVLILDMDLMLYQALPYQMVGDPFIIDNNSRIAKDFQILKL
jgi:hypothetical protein